MDPLPTSALFIDGTNLDRSCLEKFGRNDIDFEKLLPVLSAGTQLTHTYYVTAPYKREIDEQRYRVQTGMINHLRRIKDVTVDLQQHRYRDVTCKKCGWRSTAPKEKGTDTAVASFLVEAAIVSKVDQLILVANDSDYAPCLKLANRKYGRTCVLAYVLGNDEREHQIKLRLATMWSEVKRTVSMDLRLMEACWMGKGR